jgi:L-fuculose-phosphate aldolase
MRFPEERAQIVRHAKQLKPDGLVVGTSGNLSVRVGDVVLATPSGLDYDDLTTELVCVCDLDGNLLEGPLEPTSEMPLHLSVYHSTPHSAVVHTHARAAAAVSVLVKELPPIHYMTALFGGVIRVADYATYGTPELAASVGKALDGRTGCLMANHGSVATGPTLANAYLLNQHLEWLCDVWLRAVTAGAALGVQPAVLPESEIAKVMEKFETYGQAAPQEGAQ